MLALMPQCALPMSDLIITPLPAFKDNYIWLLTRGNEAAVVDPGDAEPVIRALDATETSTNGDSSDASPRRPCRRCWSTLKQRYRATRLRPARENIAAARSIAWRQATRSTCWAHAFRVIDIPGHTAGHIAYFSERLNHPRCSAANAVCLRLRPVIRRHTRTNAGVARPLAALPAATRVYCGHEYTVANIRFALAVEPEQPRVANARRYAPPRCASAASRRCHPPSVSSSQPIHSCAAMRRRCVRLRLRISRGAGFARVSTFAAIRSWKDGFQLALDRHRRKRT